VYFGSEKAHVIFRIDGEGRTSTQPEIGFFVREAVHKADKKTTWEIAIPWTPFEDQDGAFAEALRFNLQQHRPEEVFSLSPTLGEPLKYATSGHLSLQPTGKNAHDHP
jgi:hypothetical protein